LNIDNSKPAPYPPSRRLGTVLPWVVGRVGARVHQPAAQGYNMGGCRILPLG
ncbi:hypothetical protein LCGC14_2236230, partial [marine sediment metagenome]